MGPGNEAALAKPEGRHQSHMVQRALPIQAGPGNELFCRRQATKDREHGKHTAAEEQYQNAERLVVSSPNFSVDAEIFLNFHDWPTAPYWNMKGWQR